MLDGVGIPSDDVPEILATGRTDITTIFVSMAARHPDGGDADYLEWHTLDHRPEQQRLPTLRASLRLVSTPNCRAARAASHAGYDGADHVMTYFFADIVGLEEFNDLSVALRNAGRTPFVLPPVQRGVYTVEATAAAPRIRAGADVLPWRPVTGVYVLLEQGTAPTHALVEIPGVAGIWSATSTPTAFSTAAAGQQITYCFLDDDPVDTAARLRPVLERRWETAAVSRLLAGPFYPVVPYAWDRYLP
ncbi:hypothetical protein [Pseudofrankia sp. BMG5.37]|uniref:hypothetical protein n=1 Tax=Pseudofrankia sp. BMG5.37 TaxID=3050035 RepID=UPI0008D92BD7|nr:MULTISPECIES: hypothetical protein [unclassified Pseudofrankia]MDT3442857.1 hypothetical protein [Pseudofrankia sp. BMG5.37]OHV74308.1 hypothetical protein BCD48_32005 [Pseudofrankia sp. BMG5.36]